MLFAALGLIGGYFTQSGEAVAYESVGQLNVLPPSNVGGLGQISASQLDRYGVAQMNVLTSTATAEAVAKEVGGGLTTAEAKNSVRFEQIPNSDVVTVTATSDSAERAQDIAQGYLDVYLDQAATLLEAQRQPEIDKLDELLGKVEERLKANDAQIADAMRQYTSTAGANNNAVPDVASVAPALATAKQLLLTEYDQLNTARGQADYTNQIRTNSFAIQDATLPTEPLATGSTLMIVAAGIVGALIGVLGALLLSTLSDSTLTETAVAATLSAPVVAILPHDRRQASHPDKNLAGVPDDLAAVVDQLCVRAMTQTDGPMRIAVGGARRGAGSTSVALAMASRYADAGHQVVVIDMDVKDQFLTRAFSSPDDERIASVLSDLSDDVDSVRELSKTVNPLVSVMGFGNNASISSVLRQDLLNTVVELAEARSDIIIIDLGPVLESTVVRHVANMVDSFVLAVSLTNQSGDQLRAVRRVLADTADRLLPVITSPAKRPASDLVAPGASGSAASTEATTDVDGNAHGASSTTNGSPGSASTIGAVSNGSTTKVAELKSRTANGARGGNGTTTQPSTKRRSSGGAR